MKKLIKPSFGVIACAALSILIGCSSVARNDNVSARFQQPVTSHRSARATIPSYLKLRPGLRLYLFRPDPQSIMAPPFPEDSQAVLFADLATVKRWSDGRTKNLNDLPHHDEKSGSVVTVNSWKSVYKSTGDEANMIEVSTTAAPFVTGWIEDEWLVPIIPKGSQLLVGDYMFFTPHFDRIKPNKGTRIAFRTPATLVDESPNTQSGPFYVQINSGPLRGRRGYFNQLEVRVKTGPLKSHLYDDECYCIIPWPVAG